MEFIGAFPVAWILIPRGSDLEGLRVQGQPCSPPSVGSPSPAFV